MNPASASILWNWSYSGGNAIGGSVTFTTDDLSGGSYPITAITGTAEGVGITSLRAPDSFAGNDNLLFPSQPQLSGGGVSWLGADGDDWNLYFSSLEYFIFNDLSTVDARGFTFTAIQVPTTPVPEPSSLLGLVGLGLALGGGAVRKMRK